MKILEQIIDQKQDTVAIVLDMKEARDLYKALLFASDKTVKRPSNTSRAAKIAHDIADLLPCW